MIRPYDPADAGLLAQIHNAVSPQRPLTARGFHGYLASALRDDGRVWTLVDQEPIGFAAVFPVPGLPHLVDLDCAVTPLRQRQGLGSALLKRVLDDLRGTAVHQVTYQVETLDSAAALFLRHNGFAIEHEEWQLLLEDLATRQATQEVPGLAVGSRPRPQASSLFLELYDASFVGLPWAQPYSSAEVAALLDRPDDLLFLEVEGKPVGFAWLHMEDGGLGVIEPLGISRAFQGQGYGRFLLDNALQELARRGAQRAQIGAWRINKAAIALYTAAGFAHYQTHTFLAHDL